MIFYNNHKIERKLKNYRNTLEIINIDYVIEFIIYDIYVEKFKEIFLHYYSKILKFIIVIIII